MSRLPPRVDLLLVLLAGCVDTAAPVAEDATAAVDLAVPFERVDLAAPTDLARADLAPRCPPCADATPLCDDKTGRCVACLADADCEPATVCAAGRCKPGCNAQHSECGDAGACDVDLGLCHGCLGDRDCTEPARPTCDLATGRCGCTPRADACPLGFYCGVGGNGEAVCTAGCKGDAECMQGGGSEARCCDHRCLDTGSSTMACGACGAVCPANDACCAGRCIDTRIDLANCGACGKACSAVNQTVACDNGACVAGACLDGFGDCDMDPKTGCETPIGSDPANCGACGLVCKPPNATPACLGRCVIAACDPGFRDCNLDAADGCETSILTDAANCGLCGAACKWLPHAISNTCKGGVCAVTSCDAGYADCNRMDADGCEVALDSDPGNCGACGNVCPAPPHVTATCTNAVCGVGPCQAGWGDCDNNGANGCEVNVQTDDNNCGACGTVCAPAFHCYSGVCKPADYGLGTDGALTVAAGMALTVNQVRTGASGTANGNTLTVVSSAGFAAGQFVLLHQTQGTGAGAWEMSSVKQAANNQIVLDRPLVNTYKNGGGDHAQVIVVPQYTTVTVSAGGTLTAPAWDGATGGLLAVLATTSISISGTGTMKGKGFRGPAKPGVNRATGNQGEGSSGLGVASTTANGNGGGGGGRTNCECCWAGSAGGGGHGSGGTAGQSAGDCEPAGSGGLAIGDAALVKMHLGGAGGAGGADEDGIGADGGNGGGSIYFASPTINVSGSLIADANAGGAEVNPAGCGSGGGGGGAGGAIFLRAAGGNLGNALVHSTGGTGGDDAGNCGVAGGAGAVGRIHLVGGITGTTSPAAQ